MEEQDVYRKMLSKIGLKRIPIILMPFALPFFILIFVIGILSFLVGIIVIGSSMILGFWQCIYCKRIYWASTDRTRKRHLEDNTLFKAWECEHCHVGKVLSEKN